MKRTKFLTGLLGVLAQVLLLGCLEVTETKLSKDRPTINPLEESSDDLGYIQVTKEMLLSMPLKVQNDPKSKATVFYSYVTKQQIEFNFFEVDGQIYGEVQQSVSDIGKTLLPQSAVYYSYVKLALGQWEEASFEGQKYQRREVFVSSLKFDEQQLQKLGGSVVSYKSSDAKIKDATLYKLEGIALQDAVKALIEKKAELFPTRFYQVKLK